ncbi:malto-oligosyltrehalose trehalohydrolase [Parvibaculum sp.]|uniref:malto-oligosyltrehalose trehalohydrolase n=1 Tax=Parvibaculum sp. TaxID=2024848 RepID=UPI002731F59C|nr:malto-oligosyltrehalose trehalohydrolase [Parvibaculum sp.]MDP1626585.1 malto-oligosyltrehalose trehalohydrolase [Parvibaculum sp.]MDP2150507.1 malto-oligosyltrehalose trehalohydrolase [Parvibaculum sp.]MDP3329559.1 malto-oligosyltrehalose trehalohydrolase [Parvibaculum sp.]
MKEWGAKLVGAGRTRFRIWAPNIPAVALEIEGREKIPLQPEGDGWFSVETVAGPGTRYRFRVRHDLSVPDPAARCQSDGVHGWSVVAPPQAYRWRVEDWRGRPWEEAIIQEVHPGLLGGFNGVAEHLPALAEIGVTAIELMPISAFSGTRNWGYDGVLPYAPAESYGTPDDLKALVDRAHELGLMIMLDVVYNHFGPDGNYLGTYAGDFFDPHIHTPWGAAVAVDREPVARFFIDNALMWLDEYRFDGLRFDAVQAIANNDFLDRMAAEIRSRLGQDRFIHLVLENENNDAERLEPGKYDAQWNDDFHSALHVLLTGETSSYYGDFADRPAERLARCLAEGFTYQGEVSHHLDGRTRGNPSGHLPPTAFVSFLQNHDQIGNRAMGERLTVLADRDNLRAATVLLCLCPQIPLFFMGDEAGSHTPFLFFTDFHDELADAVRRGRRREFAKFAAYSDEEARKRIPDPNAPGTFAASRPEPGPDADEWWALYTKLLRIRRMEIVPRLRGARSLGAEAIGDAAVVARWRLGDGAKLVMALNLGDRQAGFPAPRGVTLFAEGEAGAPASVAVWLDKE